MKTFLEYSENLKSLVKKLPYYLHEKWRNVVYELKDRKQLVRFQHLVDFVHKAKKATDPIYGREILSTSKPKSLQENQAGKSSKFSSGTYKDFATSITEISKNSEVNNQNTKTGSVFSKPCMYCEENHNMDMCQKFLTLTLKARYLFLKSKRLCFSCLKSGHTKKNC
jgi:hypothetical protein